MKTYPEMNEKIVELLKLRSDPTSQYAAARIEDLEQRIVGYQQQYDGIVWVRGNLEARIVSKIEKIKKLEQENSKLKAGLATCQSSSAEYIARTDPIIIHAEEM